MSSGEYTLTIADYAALLECGKRLTAEVNLSELLQQILLTANNLTDSPDGSVLLHDQDRNGLYFAAATGESAPMLMGKWGESSNQRVPIQGSKAGTVFTSGRSLVEDALEIDSEHYKGVDEQTQKSTHSMICVPLIFNNESIGVIQILNKRTGNYTEHDRVLLENFASQASVAIRNAGLLTDLVAHMGLYTTQDATALVTQLRKPAHREKLSVMFADMRGFTQLCQAVNDPARIQSLLEEFLSMLSDQVIHNGGIVNKFLGDGLLAIFREGDFAKHCVKSAFAIVERFDSLLRQWQEVTSEDISFLDVGIGIVTSDVILGTIRTTRVRDFTVIGTPVNLAAAFESSAREGKRILVDQITYNATKDIVAHATGPHPFELRKPNQTSGNKYRQYHLVRLRPEVPTRLFVAHNWRDRDFVEKELTGALSQYGIETWYSRFDILPGENYVTAIQSGLLKCDGVVVVVSRHSASSDWVAKEVQTALDDPRLEKKIVPVILDDTEVRLVSEKLRLVQGIDSRDKPSVAERLYKRFVAENSKAASPKSKAAHAQ
jgi:adenylate cyclase